MRGPSGNVDDILMAVSALQNEMNWYRHRIQSDALAQNVYRSSHPLSSSRVCRQSGAEALNPESKPDFESLSNAERQQSADRQSGAHSTRGTKMRVGKRGLPCACREEQPFHEQLNDHASTLSCRLKYRNDIDHGNVQNGPFNLLRDTLIDICVVIEGMAAEEQDDAKKLACAIATCACVAANSKGLIGAESAIPNSVLSALCCLFLASPARYSYGRLVLLGKEYKLSHLELGDNCTLSDALIVKGVVFFLEHLKHGLGWDGRTCRHANNLLCCFDVYALYLGNADTEIPFERLQFEAQGRFVEVRNRIGVQACGTAGRERYVDLPSSCGKVDLEKQLHVPDAHGSVRTLVPFTFDVVVASRPASISLPRIHVAPPSPCAAMEMMIFLAMELFVEMKASIQGWDAICSNDVQKHVFRVCVGMREPIPASHRPMSVAYIAFVMYACGRPDLVSIDEKTKSLFAMSQKMTRLLTLKGFMNEALQVISNPGYFKKEGRSYDALCSTDAAMHKSLQYGLDSYTRGVRLERREESELAKDLLRLVESTMQPATAPTHAYAFRICELHANLKRVLLWNADADGDSQDAPRNALCFDMLLSIPLFLFLSPSSGNSILNRSKARILRFEIVDPSDDLRSNLDALVSMEIADVEINLPVVTVTLRGELSRAVWNGDLERIVASFPTGTKYWLELPRAR